MEYSEVLKKAKETIGPNCKVCPECNGLGCGNTMPGPGSKAPGNGANDNWAAWRRIKLNMDTVAPNTVVDTATSLFGQRLSMPVITAPIGSLKWQFNPTDDVCDYNACTIAACQEAGIIACYGDGIEPRTLTETLKIGRAFGPSSVPILNPYAMEDLKRSLDQVKAAAPVAVGIVIDSAGLPHLKKLNPNAGSKTAEELRELREYAGLPFVVKGIMTAKSAEKVADSGADAIVVSNHGGRALAQTPATAEVLQEIAAAVKGKTKIIVDGGIRTGLDIFKALALGADCVMIGRPFLISYYGGGKDGVTCYIEKLRAELVDAMYMCGARSLADINGDMIRY